MFTFSSASRRNPKPVARQGESESGDDDAEAAFSVPPSVKAVLKRCATPNQEGVVAGSGAAAGGRRGEGAPNDGIRRPLSKTPSLTSYSTGDSTAFASSEDGDSFRLSTAPAANSQGSGKGESGGGDGSGGGFRGEQDGDMGVDGVVKRDRSPPPVRGSLTSEEDRGNSGVFVCSSADAASAAASAAAATAAAAADNCAGRGVGDENDPRKCSISVWTGGPPIPLSVQVEEGWSGEKAPVDSGGEGCGSGEKPDLSASPLAAVVIGGNEGGGVEAADATSAEAPAESPDASATPPGVLRGEGGGGDGGDGGDAESRSAQSQQHRSGAYLRQLAAFEGKSLGGQHPHDVSDGGGKEYPGESLASSEDLGGGDFGAGEGGRPDDGVNNGVGVEGGSLSQRSGARGGLVSSTQLDQQVRGGGHDERPPGREDIGDAAAADGNNLSKSWTWAAPTAASGTDEFSRRELRKAATAPAGPTGGMGVSMLELEAMLSAMQREAPSSSTRKSCPILLGLGEKSHNSPSKIITTSFRRRGNIATP